MTVLSDQTHRPYVFVALLLSMFVVAIEATIIATAMPSIVASLGGMELYAWVFSGFLLMQVLTVPLYGKLADLFGRKKVFLVGSTIFLAGSTLCALSYSMPMLVGARLIQGIGAGSVQSMTMTILGDLYTREERAKMQGWLASVWGVSAILGPVLGGAIVENAHWSWVFWMNLPFGAAYMAIIGRWLHENLEKKRSPIDYPGAALMLAGLLALMLAFTQAGAWGAWGVAAMLVLFAILFKAFLWRERRAPDPVMHLELWAMPVIAFGNLATFAAGAAMIGLLSFMPIFIQGVQHRSAFAAGVALCVMSVGWPGASFVTARLMRRTSTRVLSRWAGGLVLAGALIVALLIDQGLWPAVAGSFVMGAGLGVLSATVTVAIQSSVEWNRRGMATGSVVLMRSLGNALGAALFGGMINYFIQREDTVASLALALHAVFWTVVLFSALMLAACWKIREPSAAQRA